MSKNLDDIELPEHIILRILHNTHKSFYEPIEEYIRDISDEDFPDLEEKQKIIDTDSIWCIQWYPDIPTDFYIVYTATFARALAHVKEVLKQ